MFKAAKKKLAEAYNRGSRSEGRGEGRGNSRSPSPGGRRKKGVKNRKVSPLPKIKGDVPYMTLDEQQIAYADRWNLKAYWQCCLLWCAHHQPKDACGALAELWSSNDVPRKMQEIHLELQRARLQLAGEDQKHYFARVVSLGLTDLMFGANDAVFSALPDRPYPFIAAWLQENRKLVREKTSEIVEDQVGSILQNLRHPVRVLPKLGGHHDVSNMDRYFEDDAKYVDNESNFLQDHKNRKLGAKLKLINLKRDRETKTENDKDVYHHFAHTNHKTKLIPIEFLIFSNFY